jgi:putative ribosome biogenesis GTPase RsgA
VAFAGSSGVGKSTRINRMFGGKAQMKAAFKDIKTRKRGG